MLGVVVLLLMDAHEKILHIHHDTQQSVEFVLRRVVEVAHVRGEGVFAGPAGVARRTSRLGGIRSAI